jgi:23S rRNA (guanine2445-N2)-methyltransferase / 23S rRNA (guanine2069-N7)-methyltransferase
MMEMTHFFANCPKLVEGLLALELKSLGATATKETSTGVYFQASLETAYRVCLWSRLANHVLLPLGDFEAENVQSLQQALRGFDWSAHMSPAHSFRVDFSGQSQAIHHTHYGSLAIKDAIVDYFREKTGQRPSVDTLSPDIRFNAHLFGDRLTLSLDLSGESLHKRGYRVALGDAPMKENLAAALLIRAGWPEKWKTCGYLVDPMCGTGTLLIEAALMATDTAPGLLRERFGFTAWPGHDPALWNALRSEALARHEAGMRASLPDFRGYDGSPRAISQSRENIEAAGLSRLIQVSVREISQLSPPTHGGTKTGILITNPPYGERLGEGEALRPLYQFLGQRLREHFEGWEVAVLTGDPELGYAMGIRAKKYYAFFNGTIPCRLLLMDIHTAAQRESNRPVKPETEPSPSPVIAVPSAPSMVGNRLLKNKKALAPWVKQNAIHNYRLYDADMPEYAVAVDVYGDWAHVQEYAAPNTIDPDKAAQRLQAVIEALPEVLEIPADHIVVKQRRRQRHFSQYQALRHDEKYLPVQEGACKLLINLHDHLDAGLFLDHRPMRLRLGQEAKGKRFLNLYCYTGSATVHAALGGAFRSTSVDMSGPYTAWARKNLGLNGLSEALHRVIQADCMKWLDSNTDQFDLIFLDPPTFSRSKRMEDDFEIQSDHVQLIRKTLKHLDKNGVLYFSTNFRPFKFNYEAFPDLQVEDITAETIDKDFARNPKIHYCFKINWIR